MYVTFEVRNIKIQDNINFKNANGEKIRRQFFDLPLYILGSVFYISFSSYILEILFKDKIAFSEVVDEIETSVLFIILFVGFVFLLKFLNGFLFGDILCTLTARGLYCKSGFFSYDEMVSITYHIGGPTKAYHRNVTIAVHQKDGKKFDVVIYDAPRSLLGKVKKKQPRIFVEYTPFSKEAIFLFALFTIVTPIIMVFF